MPLQLILSTILTCDLCFCRYIVANLGMTDIDRPTTADLPIYQPSAPASPPPPYSRGEPTQVNVQFHFKTNLFTLTWQQHVTSIRTNKESNPQNMIDILFISDKAFNGASRVHIHQFQSCLVHTFIISIIPCIISTDGLY